MKIMVMHKSSVDTEAEKIPSQALIDGVGALVQGAIKEGRLIDGAGLLSSRRRVRVTLAGGERKVEQGPYRGQRELVSRIAALTVKSMPEAIEWGTRLAKATGDVELEIGPITEAWDLGLVPKPEGEVPLRVLALFKSTSATESGATPSPQQSAALSAVVDEATQAGVLVSTHNLRPSATASRITGARGARSVIDGPFSETKELIAGFMLMTFESKAQAVEFALHYADVVGTPEVDLREVE